VKSSARATVHANDHQFARPPESAFNPLALPRLGKFKADLTESLPALPDSSRVQG